MVSDFMHDARFAVRLFAREPRASILSILTLALGIGAATALFSLANAWLLRPLPFPDSNRLVVVWETIPAASIFENTPAPALLHDWRAGAHSFQQIAGLTIGSRNLSGSGDPERLSAIMANPEVLQVLGVTPVLGHAFARSAPAGEEVLLSNAFWRQRFASDPGVLGRTLTLNGKSVQVVGVLPRATQVMDLEADVWLPLRFTAADETSLNRYLWVVGRIRSGATVAQASAEVEAIARARSGGELGARAVSLRVQTVGSLEQDLPVLLGATGILLLIACANVASLTLARGASRRREFMVRAALGAGRARIARQLLTEGTLLALLGGVAGLLVAAWFARGFLAWLPQAQTLPDVNPVDARVFAFALGVSLLTAVLFGVAPALQAVSKRAMTGLRSGTRSVTAGLLPLRLLAGVEIALAVALLISAGLVARSFVRLTRIDLGFRPAGVTTFDLPRPNPDPERLGSAFHDELLRRLRETPGIEAAAVSQALPLKSFCCGSSFPVEGQPPGATSQLANWRSVSPEYFQTIGLPIREGRPFDARDRSNSERVAIVSASFASRVFAAGTSPLGRHIGWGTLEHPMTVIGVANDVRLSPASAPNPHVYMPYTQVAGFLPSQLAVRSSLPTVQTIDLVRRAVWAIDPLQPVAEIQTMEGLTWKLMARRRFQLAIWAGFAFVAVSLALVGVYGVVSYLVRQTTKELGIRLALGAPPSTLRWLVLRQGAGVAAGGIVLGLVVAYWTAALLKGFVIAVELRDPWTYGGVALLALVATLGACALPARRAGRVDALASVRLE